MYHLHTSDLLKKASKVWGGVGGERERKRDRQRDRERERHQCYSSDLLRKEFKVPNPAGENLNPR